MRRGRANRKPVGEGNDPDVPVVPPESPPPSTGAAIRKAERRWRKDGDRGDQDYYHIPGAGNADREDPPRLGGEVLPHPRKSKRPGPRSSKS